MFRKRMNNRGDVPVMVLVIGVVVICILTIFSFVTVKKVEDKSSFEEGLPLFEEAHADLVKFRFYQQFYENREAADKIKDLSINEGNVLIEKKAGGVEIVYEVQVAKNEE